MGALGESIKSKLKDQHITKTDLAQAAGVSTATLSKWLNGEAYPSTDKLHAIISYLWR